jgi:4-hydroxybenzoate polyprenyltransferase
MTSRAATASEAHSERWTIWLGIGRPHILAIVFASSLTYGWIFTETHSFLIPAIAVWDWFIVNFMNKATDIEEDIANNIPGAQAAALHQKKMEVLGFVMIISGLVAGHFLVEDLLGFRLVFTFIGLAYNYKLLPWFRKGQFIMTRFKEMYFFKNFGSSMLFTLSVFLYPLFGLGAQDNYSLTKLLFAIAFFIPLELTYEIIYDLRDIEGDTASQVPTYPVIHGAMNAKKIIYGLLIFSSIFPILGALSETLRLREWIVVFGIVQQFILMRLYCSGDKMPTSAQAVFITWLGAVQLFSYNIWIVIGLPLGA